MLYIELKTCIIVRMILDGTRRRTLGCLLILWSSKV